MRIVFLDFDGPIITRESYYAARFDIEYIKAEESAVKALNRITDATGACIVVSSSWRIDGLMKNKERLHKWGVTGKVLDVTPVRPGKARGFEIQEWIDTYEARRADVTSFVIFDDDTDMAHLLPDLIVTPFDTGITEAQADEAIKKLLTTRT